MTKFSKIFYLEFILVWIFQFNISLVKISSQYKWRSLSVFEAVLDMAKPLRHERKVMRVDLPKKCIWKENDSCFRHFADHKSTNKCINGKLLSLCIIDFKVCSTRNGVKMIIWRFVLLNKNLYVYIADLSDPAV